MNINPGTKIGKKLWEFLQKNPMTIKEVAKRIGVSDPTIKRLLEENVEPGFLVTVKINNFLKEQDV